MSLITLSKHHGLGNDFLIGLDVEVPNPSVFAKAVCDRTHGIGADGLIIGDTDPSRLEPGVTARMVLYNADGSRAEISGNGIRCFAQAIAHERGDLRALVVATDAGNRSLELNPTDRPDVVTVSVDMGEVADLPEPSGWGATECHPDRPVAHLSLGNPHSVVGVEDLDVVDLADLGGRVPNINLEIVTSTPQPDTVRMRVHERGVGITEACGSGAVATAVAAARWGLGVPTDGQIHVEMDGGSATVIVDHPAPGRATLVGPATRVGSVTVDPTALVEQEAISR